jgi:hypothetical protein
MISVQRSIDDFWSLYTYKAIKDDESDKELIGLYQHNFLSSQPLTSEDLNYYDEDTSNKIVEILKKAKEPNLM